MGTAIVCETCEETRSEVIKLKTKVGILSTAIGNNSSFSQCASADASETKGMMKQFIKTVDERYEDGKAEHKSMWRKLDLLMGFYYMVLGGALVIDAIYSLIRWVFYFVIISLKKRLNVDVVAVLIGLMIGVL